MKWALVTVIPNTDLKVGDLLVRRGYRHHIFRQSETIIRRGAKVKRLLLLFPRYVFVHRKDCWTVKHLSDDILGPVRMGEEVCQVPRGYVEQLVRLCKDNKKEGKDILPPAAETETEVNVIKQGSQVIITGDGAFSDKIGTYLRPSHHPLRAMVEFKFMGGYREVSIEQSRLLVLEEPTNVSKRKRYGGSQLAAQAA